MCSARCRGIHGKGLGPAGLNPANASSPIYLNGLAAPRVSPAAPYRTLPRPRSGKRKSSSSPAHICAFLEREPVLTRAWRSRPVGFLEGCDVQLHHPQERIRHPLRPGRVLVAHQLIQDGGNDLPTQTEPVDEPAAGLRLASSLEQGVPVAV